MPAARPDHDAYAIWLTVVAEFGEGRATRERACGVLHDRMKRDRVSPKRGQERTIDKDEGVHCRETLSPDRIEKLFNKAQRSIKADDQLAADMYGRAAQLRSALAQKPGSYLLPFRPRSSHAASALGTWVVVQHCPHEQEMFFHAAHEIKISIEEADDPHGPFKPVPH